MNSKSVLGVSWRRLVGRRAVPFPVALPRLLVGPRVRLRAFEPDDAPEANAAIRQSMPQLHRWLPWAAREPSLRATRRFVRTMRRRFRDRREFHYFLTTHDSPAIMGCIGVWRRGSDAAEIGYWLGTAHIGHGTMTEAALLLTDAAFDLLDISCVEIYCAQDNVKSRGVPMRLGFTCTGRVENDRIDHQGRMLHTLIYAMNREQWGNHRRGVNSI